MGLLAQYQQLTADAATVTADTAKLATDQATATADTGTFVADLGTGKLFPAASGVSGDYDLVVPDGSGGYKVAATYSLAT